MTIGQKLYFIFQYYLNKRIVGISLNGIVVCIGIGHLVGFMSPLFGYPRIAEYLSIIITTMGVIFSLYFFRELFIYFLKDVVFFITGIMSDKRVDEIRSGG